MSSNSPGPSDPRPASNASSNILSFIGGLSVPAIGWLVAIIPGTPPTLPFIARVVLTMIVIWLFARDPQWLSISTTHLGNTRFRTVALLVVGAVLAGFAPAIYANLAASKERDAVRVRRDIESSVGVANVTAGDTRYEKAIGASGGDHIIAQVYLRNISIDRALDGSRLKWSFRHIAGEAWALDVSLTATGELSANDEALIELNSTKGSKPTLAADTERSINMRSADPKGTEHDTTLRSDGAMSGELELPTLQPKNPYDSLTVALPAVVQGGKPE